MGFIEMFTGVSGVISLVVIAVGFTIFAILYGKKGKFKEISDVVLEVAPDALNIGKAIANSLIPDDNPKKAEYEKWFGYINAGIDVVDDLKEDLKENEAKEMTNEARHQFYQDTAIGKAKELAKEFGGVSADVMSESIAKVAVSSIRNFMKKEPEVLDLSEQMEVLKNGNK
jgi:hypothetical protein